jgi:hypothetical protein
MGQPNKTMAMPVMAIVNWLMRIPTATNPAKNKYK